MQNNGGERKMTKQEQLNEEHEQIPEETLTEHAIDDINYEEEQKKIAMSGKWLKFPQGNTIITALAEPSVIYQEEYNGKMQEKRDLRVKVEGIEGEKTLTLYLGGGKSLYSKFIDLALENGGKMEGMKIRVNRKGIGKTSQYFLEQVK